MRQGKSEIITLRVTPGVKRQMERFASARGSTLTEAIIFTVMNSIVAGGGGADRKRRKKGT